MLDLLIAESRTDQQVSDSLNGFVHRIQRYMFRLGVAEFEYDAEKLAICHKLSMNLLHHYINPSCFKAAAALTIGVCATRPFGAQLPPQTFKELALYPNAVFSVLESAYWLHGAELLIAPDDVRKLTEPIEFSEHFFREFTVTSGKTGTYIDPENHNNIPEIYRVKLRALALTYEALAYQRNGHCKYPPPTSLQVDKYFNILA
jgi:hypothetical protein